MAQQRSDEVTESLHFDRGVIYKHEDTPEGFLRLHMTIAKVGELKYFNKDGSERLEVVTPEVLFDAKSIDSFKMKPITSPHHPPVMLNADNAGAYSKGMTGNLVTIDGDFLGIVATVTDAETIRNVKSGRTKQVSCGYLAGTKQRSDGKFDQLYRMGNHVTICEQGRAGADVRVNVDSAEGTPLETFVSEPIYNNDEIMSNPTNSTLPTLETITLKLDEFESITIPTSYARQISDKFKRDADSVASAKTRVAELEEELKAAKTSLAGMLKDKTDAISNLDALNTALKATGFDSIEALAKEKDSQTARADQLADELKQLKEAPVKLDTADLMIAVKARRELERKCDGLLPKDFNIDEASDRQLREAVVINKSSLTTLEGRNDAYVEARFDSIVEAHENRDTSAQLAASARQASSPNPQPELRADVLAWAEMVTDMTKRTAATAS